MSYPGDVRQALTGPVASVSTPFNRDGCVDRDGLRRYIDFVIAGGSHTVMLTHGDSLYSALTDEEVGQVTALVAEHTAGRALVVAADRQWATTKELAFARFAREAGADVLMVLPPDWALSCTRDTLVDHYAAVAGEIPVMVVTNYLIYRPMPFGLELLDALCDRVPGVVAVKDDVCGEFARKMGASLYGRTALISGGQKQNHMNALPYGCDGYLSTFIKFKPSVARDYWQAVQSKDYDRATAIINTYDVPFFDFIHALPGGFDAGLHGAIELFGVAQRWRPKPYHSLSDGDMERLAAFLTKKGLL